MRAIILAGGRGSRMGDSTKELPKCLTKLFGNTLLELELHALKTAGIKEIGLITGYNNDKIKIEDAVYFHNDEWEKTNMVYGLTKASEWLSEDNCIISYSDIVYEASAIKLLENIAEDIVVIYNTNWLKVWKDRFENPLEDAETFKIKDSYITEIGKKASSIDEIEGQYMGLIKMTPKGWEIVSDYLNKLDDEILMKIDMTTLLSNLVLGGVKIKGVPYSGLWLEADNQNDIKIYEEKYENDFFEKLNIKK